MNIEAMKEDFVRRLLSMVRVDLSGAAPSRKKPAGKPATAGTSKWDVVIRKSDRWTPRTLATTAAAYKLGKLTLGNARYVLFQAARRGLLKRIGHGVYQAVRK